MSAEEFMRLTRRFSAGDMEIRGITKIVCLLLFLLGWLTSNVEEWRKETTLNTFAGLGFFF